MYGTLQNVSFKRCNLNLVGTRPRSDLIEGSKVRVSLLILYFVYNYIGFGYRDISAHVVRSWRIYPRYSSPLKASLKWKYTDARASSNTFPYQSCYLLLKD